MNDRDWQKIGALLVESTQGLFQKLGATLESRGTHESGAFVDEMTVAVIGFAGDAMRGSLVIGAARVAWKKTHPLAADRPTLSEDDVRDWAGELANQLIGRLKIRLLRHGITIQLGTPTTMSGRDFKLGPAVTKVMSSQHRFEMGSDWVIVRLDAVVDEGVTLQEAAEPTSEEDDGGTFIF
ncbi:MAG TPA: chemotaxis protein CheX [Polyangiaceae bacterium]|nr:chemotaxis protein CheX [Polyangiaceae bacterium]